MTWHDGDLRPDETRIRLPESVGEVPVSGTYWIGEQGVVFKSYRGGSAIVIRENGTVAQETATKLPSQNHYHDWVDGILEGRKSCADFAHGGPLTETVLAGAITDRVSQQWLQWDREKMTFDNSAEANRLVRREYRDGWRVEGWVSGV